MLDQAVRSQIRAAVVAHAPIDDREALSQQSFLKRFDELADPFSESAGPVHVTGSAIVVGKRGVVLHKHKRLGIWLQPGGHIEPGELPWEGALREATEETGLAGRHPADGVRFVHLDVHPGPRGHTHLDLRYLVIGPDADPSPSADESPETYWFSWPDAMAKADEGLRGALLALAPACTFRLRRATPADAAAVAEVFLRSRRYGLPTIQNAHTDEQIRGWMAGHLIPETEVWVGVDGMDRVVGMIGLKPAETPDAGLTGAEPAAAGRVHASVEHLYLDPSVIGMGLGEQCIELAKQRFPNGLQLWAFQVNGPARRFYARQGFAEVEYTDGRDNEEHEPDVRMTWQ